MCISRFNLFKNDSLGMGSSSERIGLPPGSQMGLLIVQIGPSLDTTILDVFAGGSDTGWFTHVEIFQSQ
jgi:hypothetical protein